MLMRNIVVNAHMWSMQLDEALQRLKDTQNKLASLRGHNLKKDSKNLTNGNGEVKVKRRPPSPIEISESSSEEHCSPSHQDEDTMKASRGSSHSEIQSRPQLVIPSLKPNAALPIKTKEAGIGISSSSLVSVPSTCPQKMEAEKACTVFSGQENMDNQPKRKKQKFGLISFSA